MNATMDPKINMLSEVEGNLFECPGSCSLAHCISADCKMGKGIAVKFKKNFGRVDELLKQGKGVGEVAILEVLKGGSQSKEEEPQSKKFVYYLVTKENYWHKPKIESLRKCLTEMRDHCVTNKVENVAMPKIGCGLDKLDWTNVKDILNEIFKDTNVKITVYHLKP